MRRATAKRAGPVDWGEIRRRLAAASERAFAGPSPEQARAVLEARAAALARRPVEEPAGEMLEIVSFSLGGSLHAVEARFVRRAIRLEALARVPGGPALLLGVTPFQGSLLPVFDVAPLLGIARSSKASALLVLGESSPELGIAVDESREVARIRVADLAPPPVGASARSLVRGVLGAGLVVLDGTALLADDRLFVAKDRDESSRERG